MSDKLVGSVRERENGQDFGRITQRSRGAFKYYVIRFSKSWTPQPPPPNAMT